MISEFKVIILDQISLGSTLENILQKYKSLQAQGLVGENHLRMPDYKRWQVISHFLLDDTQSHLDVGVGVGQLVNALVKDRPKAKIYGCDIYKNTKLQNLYGYEYFSHDLTNDFGSRKWDTVSCLETIEHIDSGFDLAVSNLKSAAIRQLLVAVPFQEPLPLSKGHYQRFDVARLKDLFPDSHQYLCVTGRSIPWVLVDYRI